MPRPHPIRQRVIDVLGTERRWMTLREVADLAKTSQKGAHTALRVAVAEWLAYKRDVNGRSVYCIATVPMLELDPAAIAPKKRVPPPRAWTIETVRRRCDVVGDCWIWKEGVQSKGYPQASINGKSGQSVRTYLFTELLGRPGPRSRRCCLTTLCENTRCVSPACLVVRQRSSILRDQWSNGERQAHTFPKEFIHRKLTDAQVDEIRALEPGFNQTEVARRMGVHTRTVLKAFHGKTFRQLPASNVFEWRP